MTRHTTTVNILKVRSVNLIFHVYQQLVKMLHQFKEKVCIILTESTDVFKYFLIFPESLSTYETMEKLKSQFLDPSVSVQSIWENLQNTTPPSELEGLHSFASATEAKEQMLKDEMSWRKAYDIPVALKDSVLQTSKETSFAAGKVSFGEFFQNKVFNYEVYRYNETRNISINIIWETF